MKKLITSIFLLAAIVLSAVTVVAQSGESDLNIFGYYQTWLQHNAATDGDFMNNKATNSFYTQQLNLFLQKNVTQKWSSFVSIELNNTFSSERKWGGLNLEEAWLRYKYSDAFKLTMGLLVPEFNNLNKIKNRSPLLPYIFRPAVYERSLDGILNLGTFTPERAFVEASGTLPAGKASFDYSAYIGNSPNIAKTALTTSAENSQSATDTTDTFLFGSRIGIRFSGIKAGLSATTDKTNEFDDIGKIEVTRTRFGADLSIQASRFNFEGEYISVKFSLDYNYGFPGGDLDQDKDFFYGLAGFEVNDSFYCYMMYSRMKHRNKPFTVYDIDMPQFGITYSPSYRIKFKLEYGDVNFKLDLPANGITMEDGWGIYSLGVSVFF
ncbi:MAG: hypothetical protein GY863_05105 [bacterium]|nr:hypothetical protein [bacterium]